MDPDGVTESEAVLAFGEFVSELVGLLVKLGERVAAE